MAVDRPGCPDRASGVRVLTPAKVNLHLGVHAERDERGYHRVDSVMAALALCDEVTVRPSDALHVEVEPALDVAPEKSNVGKAALRLAEALGCEPQVQVQVKRAIPMQAGLGGSSSDAGGTLRALCALWGVDVADERVVTVARGIGADVPFFLDPVPAYFAGAGDVLVETFPALPALPVALIKPGVGVSTPAAYAEFDRDPVPVGDLAGMCEALRAGDAERVVALLTNNLEPVACRLVPAVAEVRTWLVGQPDVQSVLMAGSGSCVFAVCESSEAAAGIAEAAAARGWWSCATTFGSPQAAEVC